MGCPACGCEELVLLGVLGNLEHVRCRACGADSSHEVEHDNEETEDEAT